MNMIDNPKQFLNSLPNKPGVYEMYDIKQQVLYVGKAKNLKKRLSSYFRSLNDPKTQLFMAKVKRIETIVTPNETAALLLESNLIKTKKPRYNVLFKDDKSFPYIVLSQHTFPRLGIHRGVVDKKSGKYFGPFPDISAVNFVLNLLQKIFRIRVCKDSYMSHRSRPCMLYQIKLCSAPCVGHIDKATYALQVKLVDKFLGNKSDYIVQKLTKLMDIASAKLAYEQAATYRDQIASIRKIQTQQIITKTKGDYDVIAVVTRKNDIGINILFVRGGLVVGNRTYFPESNKLVSSKHEILQAFIMHYYLQDKINIKVPNRILLNIKLPDYLQIEAVFSKEFGHKTVITNQIKGIKKQLITMAEDNALNSLKNRNQQTINYTKCLLDFKNLLHLSSIPQRIECFDVSHTMGESQVVSCVVFRENGPSKSEYRRYNIKKSYGGDDCGALREALIRRYGDLKEIPDVVMVDGGKGQLNVASQVLKILNIQSVAVIAIAKGKARKTGSETIYTQGERRALVLSPQSLALHFIQQIRDEAHRFAIVSHRKKMIKSRHRSELENIIGVGKIKRTLLLKHFGGIAELRSVGLNELSKVKGVGYNLAKRIYDYLHA